MRSAYAPPHITASQKLQQMINPQIITAHAPHLRKTTFIILLEFFIAYAFDLPLFIVRKAIPNMFIKLQKTKSLCMANRLHIFKSLKWRL